MIIVGFICWVLAVLELGMRAALLFLQLMQNSFGIIISTPAPQKKTKKEGASNDWIFPFGS